MRKLAITLAALLPLLFLTPPAAADYADSLAAEQGRGNGFGGHLGASRRSESRQAFNPLGVGTRGSLYHARKLMGKRQDMFGMHPDNRGSHISRSRGVGDKTGHSAQMSDKAKW